jgi:hypothetical protein
VAAALNGVVENGRATLALKPVTYQRALGEGIPFDQLVASKQDSGTVRIVVVDENSGRMGPVTVPDTAFNEKH